MLLCRRKRKKDRRAEQNHIELLDNLFDKSFKDGQPEFEKGAGREEYS